MLSTILEVVKFFLVVYDKEQDYEEQQKNKVADILENISGILKDTYNKISSDNYPHDNCKVLEILCNQLQSMISNYLSEEQRELLTYSISQSINIEKLYHERQDKNKLEQLLISSGEFRALSMIIKTN